MSLQVFKLKVQVLEISGSLVPFIFKKYIFQACFIVTTMALTTFCLLLFSLPVGITSFLFASYSYPQRLVLGILTNVFIKKYIYT